MDLVPADFCRFFEAIHGYKPFPWQQRLVNTLAQDDQWPDVLDLPTGAGKTAALDAAVFHLALRSEAPANAALRIALVVDRRLVVDDAFSRAQKIADVLAGALRDGVDGGDVVLEVARRLQKLAGEGEPPLVPQRLRGGAPLEHDWARTPTQPTILCSTVDQVGSRLLFRGYGVSDRMKPIHAGLLGVGSLILLDEVHLSEPFRQTLAAVREIGGADVKVAVLSATPGTTSARSFELEPTDRIHPELRKRLEARKLAALKPPVRGKASDSDVAKRFACEAREIMGGLQGKDVSPAAVAVIVNRVALARAIHKELASAPPVDTGKAEAMLLIGRSRSVDRDDLAAKLAPFRTGAADRAEAKPLFIVATQCLEVGVDLDLDGLVTQAASLDALRQRFGRLNRAGRPVHAKGAILALADDVAKKADDPVYGDRIRLTWEALRGIAESDTVDFGVVALPTSLARAGIDQDGLAAKRPYAPVVMPAYLDLWSQTSPRPTADPDVSLFLHGTERTTAGVSIVWRSDLDESDLTEHQGRNLTELIRLMPPRSAEAIEVSLWAARAWLSWQGADVASMSDAPERVTEEHRATADGGRPAFRWAGADDRRTGIVEPRGLRAGDLIVVPSVYGGCDEFGWAPDCDEPVSDVADKAAEPYRGRRFAVRVAPDIVTSSQWHRVAAVLNADWLSDRELVAAVIDALPPLTKSEIDEASGSPLRDAREPLEALRDRARGRIDVPFHYDRGGAILLAERGIDGAASAGLPATEDDASSHTSTEQVLLDCHGRHVADLAERFARTLGLEEEAGDLSLAAFLHDAGKADPRFQIMLSGGDPWNHPDGPPLAKSGRPWSPRARSSAGLSRGWRHEALSVRMARAHPRFREAHDPLLVLWLIGSHHGFGRPFFGFSDHEPDQPLPPCLDVEEWQVASSQAGPQSLAFDHDGADWPTLFEQLKREYGIWCLAHLEAILRLADHRASEAEAERQS